MNLFLKNILWLFSLILITGCASSYLINSRSNIDEKKQYKKIVVIAKSKNQTVRFDFEQQITKQLVANGVNAVTSDMFVPHSVITNNPTKDELELLRLELVSKGVDGIIITSLIDKENFVEVLPNSVMGDSMRDFGSGWALTSGDLDRTVSGVVYYLESALYDISIDDNNLHWIANFKVKELGKIDKWVKKFATDLSMALVDEKTGAIPVAN